MDISQLNGVSIKSKFHNIFSTHKIEGSYQSFEIYDYKVDLSERILGWSNPHIQSYLDGDCGYVEAFGICMHSLHSAQWKEDESSALH